MREFSYATEKDGAVTLMRVKGFLDAHTATELEKAMDGLINEGAFRVIVDFSELDYISSAGLGVLMAAISTFREHQGDLKLVKLPPKIFKVFDLLGFSKLFQIFETEKEARDAFALGKLR
ncbi:MAG: STAS domain-containing protein [Bacteroidota bacterium]